jgi:transcriptional regulator with XRE-family HTH domain
MFAQREIVGFRTIGGLSRIFMSFPPPAHPIGERLRQHREKIGLSVRTLASRAGFSPSFISQVENGVASPSIGSLEKIAACLQVTLSELFHERESPAASPIVRATERPRMESGWSLAEIASLRSDTLARLEPLLVTMQPGGASGRRAHAVRREQFVFILSGQVTVELQGTTQLLSQGDAVTVRAHMPALWVNSSERPVQILFVSPAAL